MAHRVTRWWTSQWRTHPRQGVGVPELAVFYFRSGVSRHWLFGRFLCFIFTLLILNSSFFLSDVPKELRWLGRSCVPLLAFSSHDILDKSDDGIFLLFYFSSSLLLFFFSLFSLFSLFFFLSWSCWLAFFVMDKLQTGRTLEE